jgi:hypothetical protein
VNQSVTCNKCEQHAVGYGEEEEEEEEEEDTGRGS